MIMLTQMKTYAQLSPCTQEAKGEENFVFWLTIFSFSFIHLFLKLDIFSLKKNLWLSETPVEKLS